MVKRAITALAVASLTLSVVATSVSAATPDWSVGVVPAPAAVSVGADAGYIVTITNNGGSNISQAYLTDALQNLAGTEFANPDHILGTTYVSSSQGSCDPVGVRLACSLGAIRAHKSATVVVAYTVPDGAVPFERIFEANTTGVAGDKGGSSHGDVRQAAGTTDVGSGPDFAGRFIADTSLIISDAGIGAGNNQSTKVTAPKRGIGVSVKDGTSVLGISCTGCWSETSEVHVDGGAVYGQGFKVEIGIYKDLTQTVHGVVHEFDAGHVPATELITTKCSNSTPPKVIPCFSVDKLPGGSISVTVWLTQNGKIRFN
jgi:uncharacterized repeat protein (TIGR01451 family)